VNIRFLTPTMHGVVDYAAAAGLLLLPFVLGLGASSAFAVWLSVAAGLTVITYSLLTGYALSAAAVLPFKAHLAIDFFAAIAFVVAPFAFGFQGIDALYYWVLGGVVLAVVAVSQQPQSDELGAEPHGARI